MRLGTLSRGKLLAESGGSLVGVETAETIWINAYDTGLHSPRGVDRGVGGWARGRRGPHHHTSVFVQCSNSGYKVGGRDEIVLAR